MLLMFVVFVLFSVLNVIDSEPKCCGINSKILEEKSVLKCVNQTNMRNQMVADTYNFLETNLDGKCADFNGKDFFIYTVYQNRINSTEMISNPFPKCCPIKYLYNTSTHSCVPNNNINFDINNFNISEYFDENFINVGLLNCDIITDNIISNITPNFQSMEKGMFCLDRTITNNTVLRECQNSSKICNEQRCIKKCCPDGKSFINGSTCFDTYIHGIDLKSSNFSSYIEDPSDNFTIINNASCGLVTVYFTNTIQYTIMKNGIFRYYSHYTESFMDENLEDSISYCIEYIDKADSDLNGYYMLHCLKPHELEDRFRLTIWAKIVSCIFLILTIILYVWLGEAKSQFGKILINYCSAMFALMLLLLIIHTTTATTLECKIRAYFLLYFATSTFTWVNVMSLDIWGTFGTSKQAVGQNDRSKSCRRLICYSLYGWGLPLLYIYFIMILENTSFLPNSIQPRLGQIHCFFEKNNYAMLLFLNVPELIFQLINTVLFIRTVICFIRIKNNINKMNDSSRNAKLVLFKERLTLILKLAIIMGLIWIFEIITGISRNMTTFTEFTKNVEIVLDTLFCLQGIFIFLIFICKQKTYNNLKEKLGWKSGSESSSVTPTSEISTNLAVNRQGIKMDNS